MSILDTLSFVANHPLNRERKLQSMVRFLKWQIGSSLSPGTTVHNWINGSKFYVQRGETALTGNIYTGLFEFADMGFLLHFLRGQDLYVDVGANAGSFTILACSVVGARGIAFEPVPSIYARLVNNVELNYLSQRVVCVNKAVGAEVGRIAFTSRSGATNHALATNEACIDSISVEMTTLDSALANEAPALLKIDVEGFESAVVKGSTETLGADSLKAVIMELNGSGSRYGFVEDQIVTEMFRFGFESYCYDPFLRELTRIDGKNLESGNTIFIRDASFAKERVQSAVAVEILGRLV